MTGINLKDLLNAGKTKAQPQINTGISINAKPATSPLAKALTALTAQPKQIYVDPAVDPSKDITVSSDLDLSDVIGDSNKSFASPSHLSNYTYAHQAEACDDEVTKRFYEMMHELVNSFEHADIANHMRNVRAYLQEHRHLETILRPDDIHAMVRALRTSYGNALASRKENKTKRTVKAQEVNDVLADLGDLGF